MANLSGVTANRIVREATSDAAKKKRYIAIVGLVLSAVAGAAGFAFFGIGGAFVGALFLFLTLLGHTIIRPDDTLLAGAEGEQLATQELSKLSDEYWVFSQLDLPNKKSRTGVNEADLVVAGPNGVFVIEVKHNNGVISGSEGDREWVVEKTGRAGGQYSKTMRNPIAQVKRLVWLLSQQLDGSGRRPWIQGIVLFSNGAAELNVKESEAVPCLRMDEILDYIQSFPRKGVSGGSAVRALQALKAGKPVTAAPSAA